MKEKCYTISASQWAKRAMLMIMALALGMGITLRAQDVEVAADTALAGGQPVQSEFCGCKLGETTLKQAQPRLLASGIETQPYDAGLLATGSVTMDSIAFKVAYFEFTDKGRFSQVIFMENDLDKDAALQLCDAILTKLSLKYMMVKRTVDGIDNYFTASGDVTCMLRMDASGTSGKYWVSLGYELGTPQLK